MSEMGAIVKGLDLASSRALQAFDFDDVYAINDGEVADIAAGEAEPETLAEQYERAARMEANEKPPSDTSLDFFPTPHPLALLATRIAAPKAHERLLEPSAGTGRLLEWIPEGVIVQAVEARQDNWGELALKHEDHNTTIDHGDFLRASE